MFKGNNVIECIVDQNLYLIIFFLFSDKERAYLIVKAVVRLSDPAAMDLVLRKRIAFNIYKRHSITDKIRRKMGHTSSLTSLGVFYEVVSNIPKVSVSNLKMQSNEKNDMFGVQSRLSLL